MHFTAAQLSAPADEPQSRRRSSRQSTDSAVRGQHGPSCTQQRCSMPLELAAYAATLAQAAVAAAPEGQDAARTPPGEASAKHRLAIAAWRVHSAAGGVRFWRHVYTGTSACWLYVCAIAPAWATPVPPNPLLSVGQPQSSSGRQQYDGGPSSGAAERNWRRTWCQGQGSRCRRHSVDFGSGSGRVTANAQHHAVQASCLAHTAAAASAAAALPPRMHMHHGRRYTRCLGCTGGSTSLRTCIVQGCKDVLSIFRPLCADTAAPHGGVSARDPTADGTEAASKDAQPAAITQDHASSCAGTCEASGGMENPAGRG